MRIFSPGHPLTESIRSPLVRKDSHFSRPWVKGPLCARHHGGAECSPGTGLAPQSQAGWQCPWRLWRQEHKAEHIKLLIHHSLSQWGLLKPSVGNTLLGANSGIRSKRAFTQTCLEHVFCVPHCTRSWGHTDEQTPLPLLRYFQSAGRNWTETHTNMCLVYSFRLFTHKHIFIPQQQQKTGKKKKTGEGTCSLKAIKQKIVLTFLFQTFGNVNANWICWWY